MELNHHGESADFEAWSKELHGTQPLEKRPAHEAYGQIVLNRDANGRPTYLDPIEVPVDKYGLPMSIQGAEPDAEQRLQLGWDAALNDYWQPVGRSTGMALYRARRQRAVRLLRGEVERNEPWRDYVRAWQSVGFTPEVYVMVHEFIPRAVTRVRQKAELRGRVAWFEDRLQALDIVQDDFGARGRDLQPEHWADLPHLTWRVTPLDAVEKILGLGM